MEYQRPIQCIHCRQRLSPAKENEVKIICPGCRLETPCEGPKKNLSISKFRKSTDPNPNPKTTLNAVPSPFLPPPSSRPNKRAVLCGVTYNNKRKLRLKGPINDVKNMRDMFISKFGFQDKGIIVLTEKEIGDYIPTKKNIEKALKWLVEDCKNGDSLVFYFSGHGRGQFDFTGNESDGFDETICPVDFIKEGVIVDNYINSIIVQPLVKGVTLHAIVDACHSGTILDLKHKYNKYRKKWDDNIPPPPPASPPFPPPPPPPPPLPSTSSLSSSSSSGAIKTTSGGLAICISACADDQVASDTTALSGNTMNGAMTYILTELVRKYPGLSYGDLLDLIHEAFEQVNNNECLANIHFFKRFHKDSFSQKPQLTSSECFDVYQKRFIL